MFGSWKSRIRNAGENSTKEVVERVAWENEEEALSEIEEELSAYINRQLSWKGKGSYFFGRNI